MSEPLHSVTVLGLGPGKIDQLTMEAHEVLAGAGTVYLRTTVHPNTDALRQHFPRLEIIAFDHLYESADSFESVYGSIVARLMEATQDADIIYCVPGSPSIGETTVELVRRLAASSHIPVRTVQGLSHIEPTLAAVGEYDASWTVMVDAIEIDLLASENAVGEIQGRPGIIPIRTPTPTAPLLVHQLYSRSVATSAKLWLSRYWPENHEVLLIHAAGTEAESTSRLPLHKLDRVDVDHLTSLFIPPVQAVEDVQTFDGLLNVTRTLRAPGGCPWDREQTHDSLKAHLIEETYEVIDALDLHDSDRLAEELGDLLFQITLHSQVAHEHDDFDISDVVAGISSKLIHRHPHVFGDLNLPTSTAVLQHWESLKQAEKPERESVLSTIPEAMPALPYSYAVQKRAANQGFEWPDMASLLGKVTEELAEMTAALSGEEPRERILEEFGDLLFVLVSVGRKLKMDPEEALRKANRKFVERFKFVERHCRKVGTSMRDLSAEGLDELWEQAKTSSHTA